MRWIVHCSKRPSTCFLFGTFCVFHFIVLHNYRLIFLLAGFKLKLFLVGRKLHFQVTGFNPCIGILMVPECEKAFNIDKNLKSNQYFSITTGLIHSNKVANTNLYFMGSIRVRELITNNSSCIRTGVIQKTKKNWQFGLKSFLKLVFLQGNWLDFFLQHLNLKHFACIRLFYSKILILLLTVESWETRNARKCSLSWRTSIFKLELFQL